MRVCMDISHTLRLSIRSPSPAYLRPSSSSSTSPPFPELRELSMKLPALLSAEAADCGRTLRRRVGGALCLPLTTNGGVALDLSDDTAFDNLPPVEISDDEEQQERESPTVVEVAVTHSDESESPLSWILSGSLSLPPNLEVLRIEMGGSITMFPKAQQHHALAALSGLCPVLREVQLGFQVAIGNGVGEASCGDYDQTDPRGLSMDNFECMNPIVAPLALGDSAGGTPDAGSARRRSVSLFAPHPYR
ncbi:hypothetical protein B0H13DRAFT_2277556 [Mycena leptocephala]|nr:hypothetical protein B0H13DRAFT_2277556 [Mycena leptocephala]